MSACMRIHIQLLKTPWIVACQAPLSMRFSRQEYLSRLPFSSPGDLPYPGIEPMSPVLQTDSSRFQPPGKSFFAYWPYENKMDSSVQLCLLVMSDFLRPHELEHARLPCPSPTLRTCSYSCLLIMPSHHLILWHPLLLSVFSSIWVFSNESVLYIRRPKYWSFSFSISPSNEY